MVEVPDTRPSLLIRIRDIGDDVAWRQFVCLYTPVVYGYARKRGLQDADAADVAQEVLRSVISAVQQWQFDPARGMFRSWLYTIAHHRVHDLLVRSRRRNSKLDAAVAQELLDQIPAKDESIWDHEYEAGVFAWAAERARSNVEPSTWQAFWLTAVEDRPAKEVAALLGMTVAAVYLAKSRIVAKLRMLIEEVERE